MQCNGTPFSNASLAAIINLNNLYIPFGSFATATNIICVMVVLSTKQMREKYGAFGVLSFGYMLNALGLVLLGTVRTQLIYDNSFVSMSTFACFGRPWPYFFIVGGQLPAFVLVVMAGERVIAVFKPLIYRTYVIPRTRVIANNICIVLSILSLLIGIVFSYLNREVCTSPACYTINSTDRLYGTFNYILIVALPFVALLLNITAYIGAKRLNVSTNMERELKKVLVSLVLAALAVVLSAVPNVILWGQGIFWTIPSFSGYLYIGFCCNSAVDLFAFFFMKEDFRNRLLSLISYGYLNRYFKVLVVAEKEPRQNMVQNTSVKPPARLSTVGELR
uniref:G-protein coupled receptors family 1 profile domain-containing protein n=1 Tax=Plectus sambesii TaxID=2011161 RepID=A0A914V6L1_9BILA